ncbi:hypothetical protein [Hymenobacter jeollabukensis]|uniref:hypothetical protein n=1 Tax=Hymenobacter jeollabukensis TaxID=2025313 RepID=UPI00148509C3|nr:hypothetical protein [Hymenobacter jeollabukensis]
MKTANSWFNCSGEALVCAGRQLLQDKLPTAPTDQHLSALMAQPLTKLLPVLAGYNDQVQQLQTLYEQGSCIATCGAIVAARWLLSPAAAAHRPDAAVLLQILPLLDAPVRPTYSR